MKKISVFLIILCAGLSGTIKAQTVSTKVIDSFNPSTVKNVYEIIRYVPLSEEKQMALARLIEEEDALFVQKLRKEVVISVPTANELKKLREDNLHKVLSDSEMDQYYRGISNIEAEAMAANVRDKVKDQLGANYSEGKFVYASFYKIYLESKVAELKFAGKPKVIEAKLRQIWEDEMSVLVEKCGITLDKNLVAKRVWQFKPNTPLR
jgi:hypothetical protein